MKDWLELLLFTDYEVAEYSSSLA